MKPAQWWDDGELRTYEGFEQIRRVDTVFTVFPSVARSVRYLSQLTVISLGLQSKSSACKLKEAVRVSRLSNHGKRGRRPPVEQARRCCAEVVCFARALSGFLLPRLLSLVSPIPATIKPRFPFEGHCSLCLLRGSGSWMNGCGI